MVCRNRRIREVTLRDVRQLIGIDLEEKPLLHIFFISLAFSFFFLVVPTPKALSFCNLVIIYQTFKISHCQQSILHIVYSYIVSVCFWFLEEFSIFLLPS